MYPQFYILHFTFTIQSEILRRFAPQDDSGGLSFVISTEQREWRNLAHKRISYERLVF